MSLQEMIRGDKTNHSSHQSRHEYKQGLLKKVAKAHSYGVSVAIVIVSECRVSCSEQKWSQAWHLHKTARYGPSLPKSQEP